MKFLMRSSEELKAGKGMVKVVWGGTSTGSDSL